MSLQYPGSSNFRHGDNHREGNLSSLIWSIHQRRKKDRKERKEDAFSLYLPEDWVPKTIEGHPAYARFIERNKGKAISVEERSGIEKVISGIVVSGISSEISGPVSQEQEGSDKFTYDDTGKLLPINLEKQMEQIPSVEENTEVWANIIYLDRDYSQESDAHILSQQETSSPTRPLSADLNQGRNSQPEGQNNMKTGDPKKCRWFNLFPWWQKK
ncbi:hypothetical protein MKW98_000288 [Papaver atlanticum]|uniref:Uncharacterized protein n=1 Tax=Papaver atlanticum TaxID=357466 RepID=A0AAD4S055_9MAGN|nr:hypothetical protein MKW98_000288 [Papaver atlanticum]